MRNRKILTAVTIVIAMTGIYSCLDSRAKDEKPKPITQEEKVKRGEYLVSSIGCDDCHSPKKLGPNGEPEVISELRLSGYPSSRSIQKPDSNVIKQGWMLFGTDLTSAAGPWGMSFAANLTSDASGIGNWTEDQFVYAIRKGKLKGLENSRAILPPMPWFVYRNLTDDDLKSIFAYLKTVPAVANVVPGPKQVADIR
ncbi:diheme cytochrome c-553 [Pollutibacter soli]|uniref:c-type cytochrome n=1 Tax=Pollutibacter soli TaxID=3034157 RepID=UPI0030136D92